jgi:hypothetical protein
MKNQKIIATVLRYILMTADVENLLSLLHILFRASLPPCKAPYSLNRALAPPIMDLSEYSYTSILPIPLYGTVLY